MSHRYYNNFLLKYSKETWDIWLNSYELSYVALTGRLQYNYISGSGKSRTRNTEEDIVAGVELLAQAIDSVIMRVQVKLLNTTVRLEYMPGQNNNILRGKIVF